MDKLEQKIDTLVENQMDLKVSLAEHVVETRERLDTYNSLLDVHIRRSESLEAQVSELYKYKYYVTGALAAVSILATVGWELIKSWLHK